MRIESSQNNMRTKIPRWESGMDSVLRHLEHTESRLSQFEKMWEERWDRLESIVTWSRIDPATSTGSPSSGSALNDDSVIMSRIETLNADVFTAMDELFEKIMRLEERIGINFHLPFSFNRIISHLPQDSRILFVWGC